MAGFEWKSYEVAADRSPGSFAEIEPEDELARDTVMVELPDLDAFPTPLAKAEILLQSACEVEHALMVQYLYSAYSLKAPAEVSDPGQRKVLSETSAKGWPHTLLTVAREEMGHLMSVENMLLLLGLAPNFEREDFPPTNDFYPFPLHLEPLTQRSLAKYVVAEAPSGAVDIDDIVALAVEASGTTINRVGVLYGLLGLIFAAPDEVQSGATGDPDWDVVVRGLSDAAFQQAPADAWHLPDDAFHPDSVARQGDPEDWQVSQLRVFRMADRAAALHAIRDIGEQGEGAPGGDELSHFARFLGIYRGADGAVAFPPAGGSWVPARDVPTDLRLQDVTVARTRRWVELADLRYALLLGFLEHYLLMATDRRSVLIGWIFAEMRSNLGYIARQLTSMPRAGAQAGAAPVAATAFTLPAELHLPADEPARWELHRRRTEQSVAKVQEMQAAGEDAGNMYLSDLLEADRARLALMSQPPPAGPIPTSYARDIRPLFRQKDIDHMNDQGLDLRVYEVVADTDPDNANAILERVRPAPGVGPMPPPNDQRWTAAQAALFERWIAEGRLP